MKIIFVRGIDGRSSAVWLPGWARTALSCCLLGLPMGVGFWLGAQYVSDERVFFSGMAEALEADLNEQKEAAEEIKGETERRIQAVSLRLAQMQAKLSRLEALGELLTVKAELDGGEFDFSAPPAVGGPILSSYSWSSSERETLKMLEDLNLTLDDRAVQLSMIADLIQDRHLKRDNELSGLPTSKGWVSSGFGMRADPFHGRQVWHNGVDIAGKMGSDVLAVAAGVVTFAGDNSGYGKMVEITHDNGYITRYGHNSDLYVTLGEIVKKGQVVSAMGSSGRSTGPHVHFEVYKHGRSVDPASYIRRTVR